MSKRRNYENAGDEPDLQELLADPVIHAIMRRDGVTTAELWAVIRTGQCLLGADCDSVESPLRPIGWPVHRCPKDGAALTYA